MRFWARSILLMLLHCGSILGYMILGISYQGRKDGIEKV